MNDKMKTKLAIIAIACLCACTSTNEQTQIQTPRTAYTAPTPKQAEDQSSQTALIAVPSFVWEYVRTQGKKELKLWPAEQLLKTRLLISKLFLEQSYEDIPDFDHRLLLENMLNKPNKTDIEHEIVFFLSMHQDITEELRRRGLLEEIDK